MAHTRVFPCSLGDKLDNMNVVFGLFGPHCVSCAQLVYNFVHNYAAAPSS